MKTKFSATVMVFEAIFSEGNLMPPHIFETGLRVNADLYLEVLGNVVFPWIQQVAGNHLWVWQQDRAPYHVSGRSLAWLEEHAYDLVDKHNSPDLNPLDYFFCGVLEARTNRRPHTTKSSLIATIKEQVANMERDLVTKACHKFRSRV